MILFTKSLGSPKSFQEAPRKLQKFQGRNPEIISLVFCKKLIFHKYIIKLTDLYLASKNKGLTPWDWITTISYPSGRNYYFFILYSFYKSSPVHLVQAKFGLDFVAVIFFKNAKWIACSILSIDIISLIFGFHQDFVVVVFFQKQLCGSEMNQRDMPFFRYQIDLFFNNFMRLNMVNHLLWHITACFTSIFYDGCEKGCTFCQKLHLLLPPKKGDKWRLNVIRISFFFLL